jgi:predicted phosphoadenosine phosphosulfate sulfurtransferase
MAHIRYDFLAPKVLPPMFTSWPEYRDYLLEKLIPAPQQEVFRGQFARMEKAYRDNPPNEQLMLWKTEVQAIIRNDFEQSLLTNFVTSTQPYGRQHRYRPPVLTATQKMVTR